MMKSRIFTLRNFVSMLVFICTLIGLFYSSTYNYLLFHMIVELFTILVGFGVFMIAWNSRQFSENDYFVFIGISFLFISSIDLVHTLSYKGMNLIHGYDANLPTQLWIAARYMQSFSFLIAPRYLKRELKATIILGTYFLITTILLASIFLAVFPNCYVEGSGLTSFKIISEYIISLIFLVVIIQLINHREKFDKKVFRWLLVSFLFMISGEIAFTTYVSVFGFSNFVGHIFKLFAFFLIYRAIIETGLSKPFSLVFKQLDESLRTLEKTNQDLTDIIAKRTKEITRRKAAEEKIQIGEERYHELFNHIRSGVVVYEAVNDGSDFIIRDINAAGQQIDGVSRKDVVGRKVSEVYPGIKEMHLLDIFQRVWKSAKAEHQQASYYKDNRLASWRENYIYKLPTGEVVSVYEDITKSKAAEEEILTNNDRLQVLTEIMQYKTKTTQSFLDYALDQALALTKSKLGYIYFYDEDKKEFTLNTWSREVMNECSIQDPQTIYQLEKTGIWGEAVRQRKPIVVNDFQAPHALKKGYPEGHAHLLNFLTIPIFDNKKIVAVVGAANKQGGYSETDILQLTLLMNSVWRVVEQRITEEVLRKSEKRFHTLAQTASDAIINIDSSGSIIFWNQAAEKIFGYSTKEMIGKPLTQLMPEESRKAHTDGIQRVATTGKSRNIGKVIEVTGVKKNGRKFPMELSLATWKTGDDIFFTAIIRDITERKKLEEEMQLDSQMLANIISGILLYKISDGKIINTNPQFEKLFGYDPGELTGKHVSTLNAPAKKSPEEITNEISASLKKKGIWEGEIQNVKKDGSIFWTQTSISSFNHSEYGEVWVSVQQDISEAKRAQLELTHLSIHDVLTGLYNRAFFDAEMERLERGRRFPVSIVMADIDGLKKINDSFGHASGDLLLKRAANALTKSFRGEDMVARIGGDEFAALLPNADAEAARQALERIQTNIEADNAGKNEFPLSISCGACTAEVGEKLTTCLQQADKKMYAAKGKNNEL